YFASRKNPRTRRCARLGGAPRKSAGLSILAERSATATDHAEPFIEPPYFGLSATTSQHN
ncbi:MAG: hypothetical protein MPL62_13590, partial [Alphaproteobacteria bacterium]|nr:hypothetical protein [Alphaproteobacteria bacterium]